MQPMEKTVYFDNNATTQVAPEIETLFMMPSESLAYVTASTVREIASYHGDTAPFVTAAVQKRLKRK